MQLRINNDGRVSANSRQFTPFDLRMFPELADTIEQLPVMIGDAELINKMYTHLAGFNRVQKRIPDQRYWPSKKTGKVEDAFLEAYLNNPVLFRGGKPIPDLEMTLAFHGMLAIADPATWNLPRAEQQLEPLCELPVDYRRVDEILGRLGEYIAKKGLNARTVEQQVFKTKGQIRAFVEEQYERDLEGAVIVQTAWDRESQRSFHFAKTIKIKNYETVDCIVLGLYTEGEKAVGLEEERVTGALLGLYDERAGRYVPAFKVNLDPKGPQIKTKGQAERLIELRRDLTQIAKQRQGTTAVTTVYDLFLMQGKIITGRLLAGKNLNNQIEKLLDNLPLGKDMMSLFVVYETEKDAYDSGAKGTKKNDTKTDKCIQEYKVVFAAIHELREADRNGYREFTKYFNAAKEVKATSRKLKRPQYLLDTTEPVIVEAQAFDIKYGAVPFAAGFHSWYCNSFHFNNVFAERVRHDKATTTDYGTIIKIAGKNAVR